MFCLNLQKCTKEFVLLPSLIAKIVVLLQIVLSGKTIWMLVVQCWCMSICLHVIRLLSTLWVGK